MKRLLGLMMSLFINANTPLQAQPSDQDVRSFHDLVQTGGKAAVTDALRANPALAVATDRFGFQAIHLLDYSDFDEILSILVAYGADPNAQNDNGDALLHMLVDPAFVPIVLQVGANIELPNSDGHTPLMSAIMEADHIDMVQTLLAQGADPNARDKSGRSILSFAEDMQAGSATLQMLRNAGAQQ